MFENLDWSEILALLVLALLIFGDKLPNVIVDGLRMLRNLRAMARNATSDLSRELGTDVQLEDLHPKAFIRKHLLSEEDEQAIRRPLQSLYEDVQSDVKGLRSQVESVATDMRAAGAAGNGKAAVVGIGKAAAAGGSLATGGAAAAERFDADAT